MKLILITAIAALTACPLSAQTPPSAPPETMVAKDAKGRLVLKPKNLEPSLQNPVISPEWLEGYRDRADLILRTSLTQDFKYNSYFENEKYALGQAMTRVLAGDMKTALTKMGEPDANAKDWNSITAGIDYYACFTIKHQPRKYFYFGEVLPPEYLAQMKEGGRLWTEQDPLGRPNPAFVGKKEGWDPTAKNSWVDGRTTDNLTMMRNTAVYLMAEETGNKAVAEIYAKKLRRFAAAIYRAGNGEWDSENYLGHTITPLFNVYDFAKDKELRGTAKAMLDWLFMAAAVKYFDGGANGPNARDYNHIQPFGGSLAEMAWIFFGAPKNPNGFEYDVVHAITSGYTPPPAVINLGTNNFDRPRELLNSKPPYHEPQAGDWSKPAAYHETYYIGHTFEFGSLAEGTATGKGDINGFKILAEDSVRGVADIRIAPTDDAGFVGSALYKPEKMRFANRVAQYRNIAIWLAKGDNVPWRATLPESMATEIVDGITFFKGEKTWAALFPVNMPAFAPDAEATKQIKTQTIKETKNIKVPNPEGGKPTYEKETKMVEKPLFPSHAALAAQSASGPFSGFAIEVGEAPDHPNYESFKNAVLAKAKLDVSGLAGGTVGLTSSNGATIKMQWGDVLADFKVWRNGQLHDWTEHGSFVYRETGKLEDGLVFQRRGDAGGTLTVNAGGKTFVSTVTTDGNAIFQNK